MSEYDVLIAGGGVAGPVAAKFCAMRGLRTLLVEKEKVPREKVCSGIQFPYFEKIIGDRIPADRLCNNVLSRVEIHYPNGRTVRMRFPMLNFMRKRLDEWLCLLARERGAEFRDSCTLKDFEEDADGIIARLESGGREEEVRAKYLVDATGLRSGIRRRIGNAEAFRKERSGPTLSYYFRAEGDLEPDTVYQFWNIEYNDAMFAWVYNKTLDDGLDYWVVGTKHDQDVRARLSLFFDHVIALYRLKNVEVVKKESYGASMSMASEERIWLGRGRVLMTGDAAGLVDLARGMGMDAAALSGRLAARAIAASLAGGSP
jgi:flavin-dependent dehydrogenase